MSYGSLTKLEEELAFLGFKSLSWHFSKNIRFRRDFNLNKTV